jgi:hypothetical protein
LAEIILKRSKISDWDEDKNGASEDDGGREEKVRKENGKDGTEND